MAVENSGDTRRNSGLLWRLQHPDPATLQQIKEANEARAQAERTRQQGQARENKKSQVKEKKGEKQEQQRGAENKAGDISILGEFVLSRLNRSTTQPAGRSERHTEKQ
eukprot:gb/GEZN01025370.1/.p2 GENE.gb/GEZN01025370.1/~~gb/GEZN01025370.1/.p2  ORF type:complete len:126 (+),score=30.30 gb/GEZN01025370.1/:57-380(+)